MAKCLTSWRHGLHRFDDSTMTPFPTCRLLPCGAGLPGTVNVNLLRQLGEGSINSRVQQRFSELRCRKFTLFKLDKFTTD